jgi:NADH:ubiquinone oxidoreductase subunit F (NADH-binding)
VSGDVEIPGVYEFELGTKLKEVVVEKGKASDVLAIQLGGATGRLLPASALDTSLSFETVLGAGAVTVFNRHRDIIDIIQRSAEFLADESCGKCFPCREGTKNISEIMAKFEKGNGKESDIKLLEELSRAMMIASSCGLGQAAPNLVMDGIQNFRAEFQNHIVAPVSI